MQYRRNYVAGGTCFFTVNLLNRDKSLLVDYIVELREAVQFVKERRPFYIHAWVVLPDHMHAVWTLPDGGFDYSARWWEIKKQFSKSLALNEARSVVRKQSGERGIWQRRFWEHTIKDERDYRHHIDYVHVNPFKHGLVERVVDWPFSSFHRAVKQGIYDASWCGVKNDSSELPTQGDVDYGERR
jgi:putative transposase